MDDLKESIKMWYNLDKRIDELNLQLSTMRDKKKELEQNVILQMKKQGLQNKKLNIGPISIIYSTSMQLPPYNLELIEDVLDKLYKKGSPQSIQFLHYMQIVKIIENLTNVLKNAKIVQQKKEIENHHNLYLQ